MEVELQEFIKLNRLNEDGMVLVIVFEDWDERNRESPYYHEKSYSCQWLSLDDPFYMSRGTKSYVTQQPWWGKVAEREVMCFGAASNGLGYPILWVKVEGEYPGDVNS